MIGCVTILVQSHRPRIDNLAVPWTDINIEKVTGLALMGRYHDG